MRWLPLALALCACAVRERDVADDAHADAAELACAERSAAQPAELKRLTMTQYRNTLRDLTRSALGREPSADGEPEVVAALALLDTAPQDQRVQGGYRRLDQALDQQHVDREYEIGVALGNALAAPAQLARVVGACATDADASNDAACLDDFIARFGARALRRPLEPDDVAFYRSIYGASAAPDSAAYADVIAVMLNAPELLYFAEQGEGEALDGAGTYALSAYELASRLSYHFWQTLPDDALWQAAQDGTLLQPAVLAAQVDRMLDDPRTRATMAELFSDWLALDDLPDLSAHVADPLYAAFSGDDLPTPELRQHMIDDALDMLAHYTWDEPAGVEALLTSERSFARSEDVARIYGVEVWDGVSEPPQLPAGERPGILTRAALLATGSANTRPIKKGVLLRRRLLCDELAPPPANVNAVPPELRSDMTTREVVEELTEQPSTVCASCHATQINPLGFVFEGFDGLGRARSEQRLFDASGAQLGVRAIDTTAVPRITPDDARVARDPAELAHMLVDSGKVEVCLARHYFRFIFGRMEDVTRDGCALERLRARLRETGRLRDMLREAALLPELRERTFD